MAAMIEVPCPECGEPVYAGMLGRHAAKDHDPVMLRALALYDVAASMTARRFAALADMERDGPVTVVGLDESESFTLAEVREEIARQAYG